MSILLAATFVCYFSVPSGTHWVEVVSEYEHEHVYGGTYSNNTIAQLEGPATYHSVSEGHPYHVRASIQGRTIGNCANGNAIFIDGFESGCAGWWTDATP